MGPKIEVVYWLTPCFIYFKTLVTAIHYGSWKYTAFSLIIQLGIPRVSGCTGTAAYPEIFFLRLKTIFSVVFLSLLAVHFVPQICSATLPVSFPIELVLATTALGSEKKNFPSSSTKTAFSTVTTKEAIQDIPHHAAVPFCTTAPFASSLLSTFITYSDLERNRLVFSEELHLINVVAVLIAGLASLLHLNHFADIIEWDHWSRSFASQALQPSVNLTRMGSIFQAQLINGNPNLNSRNVAIPFCRLMSILQSWQALL